VQAFSNDENVNVRRFDMSKAVVDENFLKERGEVSAWIAIESCKFTPTLDVLERYAQALGKKLHFELMDIE
ncbi:MAG: hypothetical protein IJ958_04355, partial [Agathobacter sp.]|nr:hypothetical protein [Agathobacter sp.]